MCLLFMSSERRELYSSPNGDGWYLCRDSRGTILVAHEPNAASGGRSSLIELSTFLAPKNQGREHQALRHLIGTLLETTETPAAA
jgi:hypothetical protein